MTEQEQKRAELVGMLNVVREQKKRYELYELSALDKEFKELCNKEQTILQRIELLDKETLSV